MACQNNIKLQSFSGKENVSHFFLKLSAYLKIQGIGDQTTQVDILKCYLVDEALDLKFWKMSDFMKAGVSHIDTMLGERNVALKCCIVPNIRFDMILGLDVLNQLRFAVDYESGTISFQNDSLHYPRAVERNQCLTVSVSNQVDRTAFRQSYNLPRVWDTSYSGSDTDRSGASSDVTDTTISETESSGSTSASGGYKITPRQNRKRNRNRNRNRRRKIRKERSHILVPMISQKLKCEALAHRASTLQSVKDYFGTERSKSYSGEVDCLDDCLDVAKLFREHEELRQDYDDLMSEFQGAFERSNASTDRFDALYQEYEQLQVTYDDVISRCPGGDIEELLNEVTELRGQLASANSQLGKYQELQDEYDDALTKIGCLSSRLEIESQKNESLEFTLEKSRSNKANCIVELERILGLVH